MGRQVGEGVLHPVLQVQDLAGRLNVHLPGVGDPHVAARSVKQFLPHFLLDLLDVLGQGRLGDIEGIRGL